MLRIKMFLWKIKPLDFKGKSRVILQGYSHFCGIHDIKKNLIVIYQNEYYM